MRARVSYAAKIVGRKLQVAIDDSRVLFALKEIMRGRGRPRKNSSRQLLGRPPTPSLSTFRKSEPPSKFLPWAPYRNIA